MRVKNKNTNRILRPETPWNPGIKDFRASKGWTQKDLALKLGVTQATIARWETGVDRPSALVFKELAAYDVEGEALWVKLAGPTISCKEEPVRTRAGKTHQGLSIRLYKDAVAAGTPLTIDHHEIENWLNVPRSLMRGGEIVALKVKGDSMYPLIRDGHIVFVDVTDKDPAKLVEKMVAARVGDGVTIKWLRRDGDVYVLVPQHTAKRNTVTVFKESDDVGIIGRVVKWIGEPPK